ncbi:MAG: type II toxin-antitoxin system VapC family toxin [Ruminiclostridium sp.]|jgi:PIN domain nuclease of toxin-antitoxin system|nr:type II toxin-antitoxin system VapC family toxin [Ruminiclostridium sp.]
MNLLLDTHILIWALNEDPKLSEKARSLILDPGNAVYYSSVSIWEVAIKHALHPDNVAFSGKELSQYCQEAGFLPIEMRDRHVYALETITRADDAPAHHDPFDRILIAQAKAENLSFLTHDSLIPYYNETCIVPV